MYRLTWELLIVRAWDFRQYQELLPTSPSSASQRKSTWKCKRILVCFSDSKNIKDLFFRGKQNKRERAVQNRFRLHLLMKGTKTNISTRKRVTPSKIGARAWGLWVTTLINMSITSKLLQI